VRCVYINLASETARRADLEANFLSHAGQGWSLARLEAVTADEVRAANIGGILRPTEKACFLSHRNAVATGLGTGAPIAVFEDDIALGPRMRIPTMPPPYSEIMPPGHSDLIPPPLGRSVSCFLWS